MSVHRAGTPPPRGQVAQAPNLNLRERNRQRAMRQIQDVALGLFEAHGFDAVTVEQVAHAAQVSASTVYRYFGTKDRLILHDEEDRIMASVLLANLAEGRDLIPSARAALQELRPFLRQDGGHLKRRFRYLATEPGVRAALGLEAQATIEYLAGEICALRGREQGDVAVVLPVTLLVNALLVAVQAWVRGGFTDDVAGLIGHGLDVLEQGVRL